MNHPSVIFGILALFCGTLIQSGEGVVNVLVLDGVASPSHNIFLRALSVGLAKKGYNVTSLSVSLPKESVPNLHNIHMETGYEYMTTQTDIDYLKVGFQSTFPKFFNLLPMFPKQFDVLAESKGFKQLMNYPKDFKFDLLIYENFVPLGLFVLTERFPTIRSLVSASPWPGVENTNIATNAPNFASFVPNLFMDTVEDNYWSRLESFTIHAMHHIANKYYLVPKANEQMRQYYPKIQPVKEILERTKIHLVNYHPTLEFVHPIMPSVIPVGGLQVQEPKPLPEDLEEIFQIPSNGVIFFSLGSNVKSELLGEYRLNETISALGSIPDYTFIWKIDLKGLDLAIPKNVFIRNWLPQNDILAHNRTVLFISHAGGLSTQEATWFGVPMLALPVMFDQFPNADKAVRSGMALKLNIDKLERNSLRETILELLHNKQYKERARVRSSNFRDQPETPLQRAIWWIDYVQRNPDMSFLQNPHLKDMSYIAKHSIDVIAFLTVLALIVLFVILKIIRLVYKLARSVGLIAEKQKKL